MRPQTPTEVHGLLRRHGLEPRRFLGQHFLADPNIVKRIVVAAGIGAASQVLEVGAGTGSLTVALAATGARVVSYEVDERFRPVLSEVLAGTGVDLRFADATRVDFDVALPPGQWTLVSNLPYNVGTPIVLDLLRRVPRVGAMLVMVQQEVADRLVAAPDTGEYGIPSVVAQIHSAVAVVFRVAPQVFVPPPRVGSAVVSLARVEAPPRAERAIQLAAAAFNQRRKMVRGSLETVLPDPAAALERAGIPGTRRAGELTPGDYLRLAEVAGG